MSPDPKQRSAAQSLPHLAKGSPRLLIRAGQSHQSSCCCRRGTDQHEEGIKDHTGLSKEHSYNKYLLNSTTSTALPPPPLPGLSHPQHTEGPPHPEARQPQSQSRTVSRHTQAKFSVSSLRKSFCLSNYNSHFRKQNNPRQILIQLRASGRKHCQAQHCTASQKGTSKQLQPLKPRLGTAQGCTTS